MDSKLLTKALASGLATLIKDRVSTRIAPLFAKEEAIVAVVDDLHKRIEALEARLAEQGAPRRVA